MSKKEKLIEKLTRGAIDSKELRTLLALMGWTLVRTRGSHETWKKGEVHYTLSAHGKDLLLYQIKEAREVLLEE